MARAKTGDLTIRMDAATRSKIDRVAKRRGLTTGALLRSLGLAAAEREGLAAKLRRELVALAPDPEGAEELGRRPAVPARQLRPPRSAPRRST